MGLNACPWRSTGDIHVLLRCTQSISLLGGQISVQTSILQRCRHLKTASDTAKQMRAENQQLNTILFEWMRLPSCWCLLAKDISPSFCRWNRWMQRLTRSSHPGFIDARRRLVSRDVILPKQMIRLHFITISLKPKKPLQTSLKKKTPTIHLIS